MWFVPGAIGSTQQMAASKNLKIHNQAWSTATAFAVPVTGKSLTINLANSEPLARWEG